MHMMIMGGELGDLKKLQTLEGRVSTGENKANLAWDFGINRDTLYQNNRREPCFS